jgi:phosphohistidine phosphatase
VTEDVLKAARKAGMRAEVVLTSPYLRASQTAAIAAKLLDLDSRVIETDMLLPDANAQDVWSEIRSYSKFKHLVLVGHEPQLSAVIAFLLRSPDIRIDLKKSALIRIRLRQLDAQPEGELKWMLTPRVTRKLTTHS